MQKVQNVNRILFLFFLLGISNSIFSQKTMGGIYSYIDGTGEFWTRLELSKDGYFNYESGMDVGVSEYGKGNYVQTKDSLILNFDLTELIEGIYHRYTYYQTNKDSVEINYRIITPKNENINGLNIVSLTDETGDVLENTNIGTLRLKKINNFRRIFISLIGFDAYEFKISGNYNYNIDIYWRTPSDYYRASPIKFVTKKYKILKNKKDYLELQQPDGTILQFKKVEKGFYSDDPFE
ncbi:conserved exported hypothetical protein [Capnocytophaga cynodegmi]|uniref:Uncharacterized protein n=2 Tax=Capnocytophaga cynodegmi TaxID=28189 RepID=A0A0B7H8U6_9FLAO|nr:conserved exported hypothetical protein [Capnocytophaga cynodegmi]